MQTYEGGCRAWVKIEIMMIFHKEYTCSTTRPLYNPNSSGLLDDGWRRCVEQTEEESLARTIAADCTCQMDGIGASCLITFALVSLSQENNRRQLQLL